MDLSALLHPHSIAVIGASRDTQKIGSQILSNLVKGDYKGKIYPVNPKATTIQGLQSYPAITDIPDQVDLAIISIPQNIVESTVDQCIEKKVGAIIIITAGFRETGEEGRRLEQDIVQKLHKAKIPMLGPNCLGIIIPPDNLNASFSAKTPSVGNIAFISQSGAFGTAAIDWASNHEIGFSMFVSLGNKALINENHILETVHSETKAIAMYLENISNGHEFMKAAAKTSLQKPIILLKPGKSEKAQQAAKSHTGALTGSDSVITTAMNQAGVIRVNTSQELFDLMKAFSYSPQLAGNKVAVITNAGGPSIMATDAIETSGLQLAEIPEAVQGRLAQYLPREANIHDPIDLIGDAKAERYIKALGELVKEPSVDAIIVILTPQSSTEIELTAQAIVEHAKVAQKPIFAAFLGGTLVEKGIKILNKNKIPCYHYPEQAVNTLVHMWDYTKKRNNIQQLQTIPTTSFIPELRVQKIIENAKKEQRSTLLQNEVEEVLKTTGIHFPQKRIVTSSQEAVKIAHELGTPVVMKISSPEIVHKTENQAVMLNLISEEQINEAFYHLNTITKKLTNSSNTTIYVQKQMPAGIEVLVGMKRDISFGPVIVIGTGGIYTELFRDTASLIAPFTKQQAYEMLTKTKVFHLINGYRGSTQINTDPIVNALTSLSNLSLTYPEIEEIDINPLAVTEDDIVALDARIVI
jgi:acetate---CoA ligase (ADP-forming)